MNKLFIMCGCPGSGKSTYAKKNFPNAKYVSRDEIRFSIVKENEPYFSKEKQVFKKFIKEINEGLQQDVDVVADATHLNFSSRYKLISNLTIDKEKTEVIAVVIQTPLDICLAQNEYRKGTRSYVPSEVLQDMYYLFHTPTKTEGNGMIDQILFVKGGQ